MYLSEIKIIYTWYAAWARTSKSWKREKEYYYYCRIKRKESFLMSLFTFCFTGIRISAKGGRKEGRSRKQARCVMRGVLGRERSRARNLKKWRVKTKLRNTYKSSLLRMNGKTVWLLFGSGHLYTICKLWVVNNRTIVLQIKVNIFEINWILRNCVVCLQ